MSNGIPLARPSLTEAERQAVLEVLQSPVLASGPRAEQFAKAIAERTQRSSGIPCSSGTAGLTLVLAALGIGPGDKVVVPAFGFVAMANAVWSLGATPLFADCDPRTLNVDLNAVAQLLELKPRAVLAAETFGNPAGMPELEALCAAHEIPLIEDACEGLGGRISGRPVGGFGRASVFGFYPNKQITTGEGGVVVTDDTRLAERCRSLANHGRGEDGATFVRPGWNFRLDEMSGALGNAQLSRLDEILDQREAVAAQYTARLSGNVDLILPSVDLLGLHIASASPDGGMQRSEMKSSRPWPDTRSRAPDTSPPSLRPQLGKVAANPTPATHPLPTQSQAEPSPCPSTPVFQTEIST